MGELMDKARGKIKQAEGKLTGNKARQAEGVLEEAKGKAKGKFEEAKTDIKRAVKRSEENDDTPRLPRDPEDEQRERISRP